MQQVHIQPKHDHDLLQKNKQGHIYYKDNLDPIYKLKQVEFLN